MDETSATVITCRAASELCVPVVVGLQVCEQLKSRELCAIEHERLSASHRETTGTWNKVKFDHTERERATMISRHCRCWLDCPA